MKRSLIAIILLVFIVKIAAYGQSASPLLLSVKQATSADKLILQLEQFETLISSRPKFAECKSQSGELSAAANARRAITALKLLDSEVLIYNSLGDFEMNPRLARVSFEAFRNDLHEVSVYVERILSQLPQNRLKMEIRNALRSYQDGGYRWGRIHQPEVINVSSMVSTDTNRISMDRAYLTTVPYTIAINWKHARTHVERAEEIMTGAK